MMPDRPEFSPSKLYMGKYGKEKGGRFEREICRDLTQWITGNKQPEIFWRSASSGAKATQDGIAGHAGGDITAIHQDGFWLCDRFVIECKSYKDYRVESYFSDKGVLCKWWDQVSGDAERDNKMPLLIMKRNGQAKKIMMRQFFFSSVAEFFGVPHNIIRMRKVRDGVSENVVYMDFAQFLEWADPEILRSIS